MCGRCGVFGLHWYKRSWGKEGSALMFDLLCLRYAWNSFPFSPLIFDLWSLSLIFRAMPTSISFKFGEVRFNLSVCQPILQRQTLKRTARGRFQEILTSVTCSTSALMPDAVQSTISNEIQNAKWKHRNIKAPQKLPWCHVIRSTIHDDEDEAVTRFGFASENKIGFCKWKQDWVLQVKTLRNLPGKPAGCLGPNLLCPTFLHMYNNCILILI